jgi:hypothetical protein
MTRLLVVGALIYLWPSFAICQVLHSIGIARAADTSQFTYIEHHQYMLDGTHRISYYDPGMTPIVQKELQYPGLPQHPEILQLDLKNGHEVRVTTRNGVLEMRQQQPEQTRPLRAPLSSDLVIDAGFDGYIRDHWEQLLESDRVLSFAAIGQRRILELVISAQTAENSGMQFTIKPGHWFLRMFIPSIQLTYDQDRRLEHYSGLSNVNSGAASVGRVNIRFSHYQTATQLDNPLPEWLSGLERDAQSLVEVSLNQ